MIKDIIFSKISIAGFFLLFFSIQLQELSKAQSIYLEWVDDPLESIVVNWVDDSGGDAILEYREIGTQNWSSESGSDRSIPGSSSKIVYTVKIDGLAAGQGYEFRVDGGNEIYKFRTAPSNLADPIKFIVAGDILDSGGSLEEAQEDFSDVSEIAASYNPYFIVVGGDIANAEGNPDNVDQWFFFFETWHNNLRTDDGFMIPILAAVGNNEVQGNYGQTPSEAPFYYTFFRYPQDQWGEKISYGKVDFNDYLSVITLDSDHTQQISGFQTDWLSNTIRNRRNFIHVIPVYHVAGWPNFRTFRGLHEDRVRNNWHPIFWENRLRLVFEHHDHNYKRTYPFGECDENIIHEFSCNFGSDARNGVIYMGGGSWGSNNNRDAEQRWYLQKISEKIHNFVVVEIAEKYRTATAIGEDNQVLDEFTDYFILEAPEILEPEITSESSFIARWEPVDGASIYKIDVAIEPDFKPIWKNYDDLNVGKRTEIELEDLDSERTYYIRVRAQNNLTTSDDSEVVTAQLIIVDPDESSVVVSGDTTVEANDEDKTTITVTVIDEDGKLVDDFRVKLFAENGNLKTEENNILTDGDGEAAFTVFNDRAEIVTYGARAGTKELSDKVEVTFIPKSPVALAASDVKNREFIANWEVVEDADTYLLDVATDEEFENLVQGYQAVDVGNVSSSPVTGISPGTEYFYRIRAVTDNLIGANSQSISVTTFPDTPVATDPTAAKVISFVANWQAAEGAKNYNLDVSRDQNFEQFVQGYENLDVGNVQSFEVDGLLPDREYFYRVQAESGPRLSDYSNTIEAFTYAIDTDNSEIRSSQLRVLANGEQKNV